MKNTGEYWEINRQCFTEMVIYGLRNVLLIKHARSG